MLNEGKIVLFRFPQTDQQKGKLRPALIVKKIPGQYNDWLICMISSQISQSIDSLDNIIKPEDDDYLTSGLKTISLFRITRLAVADGSIFEGIIGNVSIDRLNTIKNSLSEWIKVNN